MAKIGDIFEIPLSNEKKAFAQFVYRDKRAGDLVQVLDITTTNKQLIDIKTIKQAKVLFGPVLTSTLAATKYHNWKIVTNLPVHNFIYPGFLNGWPGFWVLWDGEKEIKLGAEVPSNYQNLEFLTAYSPDLIAERVITGIKPKDVLIRTNKFVQKPQDQKRE